MFDIENEIIKFTKGDSIAFDVDLKNADGTPYEMQSGDNLKMTVRKNLSENAVFSGSYTTPTISIPHTLSKLFTPGKYCYDIELDTSDGGVYTVVGIKNECERNLIVFPEVTPSE